MLDERNKSQRAEKKGRISLDILQALAEQTEREAEEERERLQAEKEKRKKQPKGKKRTFDADEDEFEGDSAHPFKLAVSKPPPQILAKEVPAEAQAVVRTAMFGSSRVKRVEKFGLGAPRVNKPARFFSRR